MRLRPESADTDHPPLERRRSYHVSVIVHMTIVVGATVLFISRKGGGIQLRSSIAGISLSAAFAIILILLGLRIRARSPRNGTASVLFYVGWLVTVAFLLGARVTTGVWQIALNLASIGAGCLTLWRASPQRMD